MLTTVANLPSHLQNFLLTLLALIAFAANSVLCRLALGDAAIDAASFTLLRLFSGAITLALLVKFSNKDFNWHQLLAPLTLKNWLAPAMLFIYAIFFSFAYLKLNTATGALILFAAVQFFLIGAEMVKGKKFIYEADSEDTCLVEYDEEPPHELNKQALETTLKIARENDFDSVRLDTFSQNKRNQKFYEARGYKKLENIYFPKQSTHPFNCYELVL